jgi:hypothetical protein
MAIGDDQDFLRSAADMDSERVANYTRYQDYYDGEHKTQLTERERVYLEASGLRFAENFCETIIDIATERMNVLGFDAGENEPLAEHLDDSWKRNRMRVKQAVIFNQKLVKGDAFVIVDLDPMGRARYSWNPSDRVKCVYSDDSDAMEYAVKVWNTSAVSFVNPKGQRITRMNIYWPDRIERYFTLAKADDGHQNTWMRYVDLDPTYNLPTGWPIPWVDAAGEPLGIPVFHFAHKARGNRYGRSDLRGVIPQADGLNKLVLDLFNVEDQQGWPQRWASGVASDTELSVAIGEFLSTTAENAKFGQFDAADPRPTLESIAALLTRMAAKSRTPIHLLTMTGTLPTGESMKTAEAPLIKKVQDSNDESGDTIESMNAMGVKLEMTFGNPGVSYDPEVDTIDVRWDDPQSRNESAFLKDEQIKQDLGVSKDTTLREMGYDPDEEAELKGAEDDAAMEREQAQMEATAKALDSGKVPTL